MELRWKILALLFFARIGLGFQFQVLGSVSPQLIADIGFNYREIGTLVGLFMIAGIFLSFPAGLLGRFFSDRVLVGVGLATLAIGGLVASTGSGFYLIGLGRIICGAGFVFGTLYFAKMIADWFSGKEVATAMTILVMSWPVGIALGQLVHPLVASRFGYSTAFVIASIYCIGGAIAILLFYRQPASHVSSASQPLPGAQKQQKANLSAHHWKLTLIAALAWGFFNAGYVVYLSFSEILIHSNGYTRLQASALASIPSWIMLFSGIVAGQIADRTGRRNLVIYLCMAGAIGSMLILKDSRMALAGVLLFGLMGAAPAGVIMALSAEAMPAHARAFGMGIFFTIYFLVVMPAPAVAGWIFDITGKSYLPLYFAGALFGATALANLLFRYTQRIAAT